MLSSVFEHLNMDFCGEISKTNSTFFKTEPLNGTQRSSVDDVESIADYNDVFSR